MAISITWAQPDTACARPPRKREGTRRHDRYLGHVLPAIESGKVSDSRFRLSGPSQTTWSARRYQAGSPEQAVSELGFVVVQIDGLGTLFRSKAFHDFSGNLADAGLEDHITALRQLARQLPYLDLADG